MHDLSVDDRADGGPRALLLSDADAVPEGASAIVVNDTRLALGRLASWWRDRFALQLIAVTGSNGLAYCSHEHRLRAGA